MEKKEEIKKFNQNLISEKYILIEKIYLVVLFAMKLKKIF
jgi:hypothetical protein